MQRRTLPGYCLQVSVDCGEHLPTVHLAARPHIPVAQYKAVLADALGIPATHMVLLAHNPAPVS